MLRKLHLISGLAAALLLTVVALSGAVLSLSPALERASAVDAGPGAISVATLASRVSERMPGVETLVRRPSGMVIAYSQLDGEQRASIIDPATGAAVGDYLPSSAWRWLKNLHRKLFLGDAGRVAVGVTAAFMLLVTFSGLALLARRMGGWRRVLDPIRGSGLQRLHNETARVVLAGLALSALTGLVMSLASFGLIPEGGGQEPEYTAAPASAPPLPIGRMAALDIGLSSLRQLTFPSPDAPGDVIELDTGDGTGAVDPATGQWLGFQSADGWQRMNGLVRMLHTGQGLWWLGLLLGAASLSVPVLGVTGLLLWLGRRRASPKLTAVNAPARDADTVLLVGSESNSTWGFAAALHTALTAVGLRVHVAPMNELADSYRAMKRLLVLTATYGDGDAPESAARFLSKLPQWTAPEGAAFAVLGFGDRQFPNFCGYARKVHDALMARGLRALAEPGMVDRQSEPEFRQWCEGLGGALGLPSDRRLDIRYTPMLPPTVALKLVSRDDYGRDASDLTAVLRFVPEGARQPAFEVSDLLGVVPPDASAPRYYSLASAAADGMVEICVRRHPQGLCSAYLTDLRPGETIRAFIRAHARFRPQAGGDAVILIGAGAGVGPLVGFIRQNTARRPMHLYFGARDAENGFLYRDELQGLVSDQRLRALNTAFSRSGNRTYVQERLLADAPNLRALIAQGAQIMVCGGRRVADGVAQAWERILAGSGLSVAQLKAQGRYVEDAY
ncbi:MAG: PepSY domain-containing protein [Burkholderiaceae bacterium]|jgi:sulfite reductase (NADPH) flavoprotein alpha-component|nr:PepSY domain-containing protein [Burkholderiaceae bacterium]